MTICQRFVVSGLVQGVFFRASTREHARQLGLSGWVRNLPGGRVEVLACGSVEMLDALHEWLWEGPSEARVVSVERYDAEPTSTLDDFTIR